MFVIVILSLRASIATLQMFFTGYEGLCRLYRLLFISHHCPVLRIEAMRMALSHVMNTFNTTLYVQIHQKFKEALVSNTSTFSCDHDGVIDSVFI